MEPAFWRLVVNVCVRFDVRQLSEELRPFTSAGGGSRGSGNEIPRGLCICFCQCYNYKKSKKEQKKAERC